MSEQTKYCERHVGEAWDDKGLRETAHTNYVVDYWLDCDNLRDEFARQSMALQRDPSFLFHDSYMSALLREPVTSYKCILRYVSYDAIKVCTLPAQCYKSIITKI